MRVWNCGRFENIEIGQKVLIARCGSGHTVFGEFGKLVRTTKQHLVFESESGSIVKTKIDILETVGKFNEYFVSTKVEGRDNLIKSQPYYWNDKKCCMEYK